VAPPVSVIIPVHDGARFLAEAIASVDEQGLDAEVVVVDDGSTDDSAAVAEGRRARCVRQARQGPSAARNAGIAASSAPVVAFLDADDLVPPGALALQLAHLATNPDAGGVIGMQRCEVLDDVDLPGWAVADGVGGPDEVRRPLPISLVAHRSTFERVGGFDPALGLSEDVDWLFRAKDLGVVIDVVPDVVRIRRIHGANLTYDTAGLRRATFEVLGARARRRRQEP
jgi:glycosyltransferase involved in cell wall biosynthesis